jgi:hypothetical protein
MLRIFGVAGAADGAARVVLDGLGFEKRRQALLLDFSR